MPQTGAHLRVYKAGTHAHKVRLEGKREKPEHDTFIVEFPGGEVEITRTPDGSHWIHVLTLSEDRVRVLGDGRFLGVMTDHRINVEKGGANRLSKGFCHVAARIARSSDS
jgi:hypothetical protein